MKYIFANAALFPEILIGTVPTPSLRQDCVLWSWYNLGMKQKKPKLRKGAWFYRIRGSYLPATKEGWLTYLPLTTAAILIMVAALMMVYEGGSILASVINVL